MQRRKGLGAAVLVAMGVLTALYATGWLRPQATLKAMSTDQILSHARAALAHRAFTETFAYHNNVLPASINTSALANFPLPDGQTQTLVVYQASPRRWRIEEEAASQVINGVVARQNDVVTTYRAISNQRTVEHLPRAWASGWGSLWPLPSGAAAASGWTLTPGSGEFAGTASYEVVMKPRRPGTLWGAVTYWFDASNFLPIGVTVSDRLGQTVLSVRMSRLVLGAPGAAVRPPVAGQRVAWQASPVLGKVAGQLGASTGGMSGFKFPPRLGPLVRTGVHRTGPTALASYGTGPGLVMVLTTPVSAFRGQRGTSFFRSVPGSPYRAVTDGIFTVVTFSSQGREITVMSSRTESQLVEWMQAAWR